MEQEKVVGVEFERQTCYTRNQSGVRKGGMCGNGKTDLLGQVLQLRLHCLQHHLADCLIVLRPHVLEDDVHPGCLQAHRAEHA